ncbi:hypothetical protein KFU94_13740 [Chloroflexi bacterium TSY]|nr:hypothetical protein [Chloroflexi bacterium TSY]MBV7329282.1 hypothetical protein [Chloroflexi bacterium TSY]
MARSGVAVWSSTILFIATAFILASCGGGTAFQLLPDPARDASTDAYPAPDPAAVEAPQPANAVSDAYPAPNPTLTPTPPSASDSDDAYPAPVDVEVAVPEGVVIGPDFTIHRPVVAGSLFVSGTGPANVPIRLIDMTEMGPILAETLIDPDGNFIFELQEPLKAEHSIALRIGDLEGTGLNPDHFQYNPNYYGEPFIGTLFDIVAVRPQSE